MLSKYRVFLLFFIINLAFASCSYCSFKSNVLLKILSFFCPCCKNKRIVPVNRRSNYLIKNKDYNKNNNLQVPVIKITTSTESLKERECYEKQEELLQVDLEENLQERKLGRVSEGSFFKKVGSQDNNFCFKMEIITK
jgi:hypothetical protein